MASAHPSTLAQPTSLDLNPRSRTGAPASKPLLEDLRLDYGPIQDIGEFLLRCNRCLGDCGIELHLAPISEIARINTLEQSSWGPFTPILDTRVGDLTAEESYCFVGRNRDGRIVAVQGGRVFEGGERSLQDLADDQSLYYGKGGQPGPGQPTCIVTSPSARLIKGRFVYSGALWVHPEFRGFNLAALLPRMSRAYALGCWGTDVTFAFVSDQISSSPLFRSYGYHKLEPSYSIYYNGEKSYQGSLMWMDQDELVADMLEFGSAGIAEIDRRIGLGRGKNKSAAIG